MRWRPDGTCYEPDPDAKPLRTKGPYVMGDLDQAYGGDGFRSPVDGSQITSRSQLREHNKQHNVEQCGDVSLGEYTRHVEACQNDSPTTGVDFQWMKPE
jgi:hypothetical protein